MFIRGEHTYKSRSYFEFTQEPVQSAISLNHFPFFSVLLFSHNHDKMGVLKRLRLLLVLREEGSTKKTLSPGLPPEAFW